MFLRTVIWNKTFHPTVQKSLQITITAVTMARQPDCLPRFQTQPPPFLQRVGDTPMQQTWVQDLQLQPRTRRCLLAPAFSIACKYLQADDRHKYFIGRFVERYILQVSAMTRTAGVPASKTRDEASALVPFDPSQEADSACPLGGEVAHMDFDNFLLFRGHFPL